jgi:hypothetical protein
MKNGILYKLMSLLWALVLSASISMAQTYTKTVKQEKTIMVKMEVSDDGKTTQVDTIIMMNPADLKEIEKIVELELKENGNQIKVITSMADDKVFAMEKEMEFEWEQKEAAAEAALKTIENELKNLKLDVETMQRMNEALEVLHQSTEKKVIKKIVIDSDHLNLGNDSMMVKVFVDSDMHGDSAKRMIWVETTVDDAGNHNITTREGKDGEKTIIMVDSAGSVNGRNMVFVDGGQPLNNHKVVMMHAGNKGNMQMQMLLPADKSDLEKAIAAGLELKPENKFSKLEMDIKIQGDEEPVMYLSTDQSGKMKATYLSADFGKIETIKLDENNGKHLLPLKKDELKAKNAKFILLEQNKKTELLKIE